MKKPTPKMASVSHKQTLSPNMIRITLHSEAFTQFPMDSLGGYIKLLFNEHGGTDLDDEPFDARPKMRTYTIRRLDTLRGEIDVDFVTHVTEDKLCGFGARWAMAAEVGDTISLVGPGALQEVDVAKDWFFFTADMTALPALSVKLTMLPQGAKGYAVVQIEDMADKQEIYVPEDMQIIWTTSSLSNEAKALPWLAGEPFVWCASEFDEMRALRQYFRNDKAIPRDAIYISSYWKRGVAEDGHKAIKKEDHEKFESQ